MKGGLAYYITKNIGLKVQTDVLFSTDPLKEQVATPGLSTGKTGFSLSPNSVFPLVLQ